MRRVQSLYQRSRSRPAAPFDGGEGPSVKRRRSTRRTEEEQVPPPPPSRVEQEPPQDDADEAQDDADEAQDDDEEAPTTAGSTSASSGVYLQGPASLPQHPIAAHQLPLIRPERERSWMVVESGAAHTRQVSGILGLLYREHFPGLVEYAGVTGPAYSFDHYAAAPDAADRDGRDFGNKAERVRRELWVSLPRTILLNTSCLYAGFLQMPGRV